MLVSDGHFPLETRIHSIEGPWKKATLLPFNRIFSPAMLIRQGLPNCVQLSRAEIRGRNGEFPSFTRWESAYVLLRNIVKGEFLAAATLSAPGMLSKYLPVPGTWEHLQSLTPQEIRMRLQRLAQAPTITPLIASDISFYFLSSTVLLYLLLQDKIPRCAWARISSLHSRVAQSSEGQLNPALYKVLEQCQTAIESMDTSVKQMFCHFLENNTCSTNALLMMISSFPHQSWRSERREFFISYGTFIDRVSELSEGSAYGTVVKDLDPKPLSQERCDQIVEEIASFKQCLQSQVLPKEEDWLKAFLIKVILELPEQDEKLAKDWGRILSSLLQIVGLLFPKLADSIVTELNKPSTRDPEQKGD